MREDEMEALLRLDNAGLSVVREQQFAGDDWYTASIRLPADYQITNRHDDSGQMFLFHGEGETRQKAIASAWQKYQEFASTDVGMKAIQYADGNGQTMFRM